MRCHLATTSAKKLDNETHMAMEWTDDIDNSYGLRENPKKTWRISDAKNLCRECGKEFKTMRALSGHMRCHSIKEKEWACKQCGRGFGSMRALFGHMRHHTKRLPEKQSEYENLCPVRRKRSKLRYKVSANLSLTNSNPNASCLDVSEVDELEEAALSLIMLSRGVTNLAELNSVLESSENDKSENWKGKKKLRGRLDSCVSGSWNSLCEKKESELGEKKADLGFSIDGLSEFDGSQKSDEFKKFELDDESGIELFDAEIEDGNDPTGVVLVKDLVREVGFLDQDDSEMMKSNSSKEATFDDQEDPEFGVSICDQIDKGVASFSGIFVKKPEYKCRTCNRVFPSYRALGGHRSGHRTTSCSPVVKIGCHESSVESTTLLLNNSDPNSDLEKLESTENVVEEVGFHELKKGKDHECPICFKAFPSGQALGGHKRAHYVGFSEKTTTKETASAMEEEVSELRIVCDLNLPVLGLENEVDIDVGFKPWWLGSDREREPLLISN
ncbi:hypothetical protein RHGRI_023078 [Rhododendron griersonianum]|uniref:C2H2-type domain-containing protein n=1 Tax=Rhododendron griersonianum TaxID=479676 RepID=A0AAV6J7M8_9ERIC|nr:hypothetical protein RHGRI_023078 [Rhododendron griersonianum]